MFEPERITETQKQFIADNFGNTELGLVRIAKNLGLQAMSDSDVVRHCHKIDPIDTDPRSGNSR